MEETDEGYTVLGDAGSLAQRISSVVQASEDELSRRLQKDATLSTQRVQAYSDAILSIIATVLVVPLTKLSETSKREILVEGKSLLNVLVDPFQLQKFGLCFVAFWFIFFVFVGHGRKFRGLTQSAPVLVYANGVELLACSLLPFTASTAASMVEASSSDPSVEGKMRNQATRSFYLNVMAMGIAHAIFELLAHYTRHRWYSRLHLLEALWIAGISVLAYVASFATVDYAIFLYLLAVPVVTYYVLKVEEGERLVQSEIARLERLAQERGLAAAPSSRLLIDMGVTSGEHISHEKEAYAEQFKSRLEAFTDGVIAISATLIVLDLQPIPSCHDLVSEIDCLMHTSDGCRINVTFTPFPKTTCVFDDSESWEKRNWLLLSYLGTFVAANTLWTLHHNLFDRVVVTKYVTDAWTVVLNGSFCIGVSFIPFTFKLVTDFALFKEKQNDLPGKIFKSDPNAGRTACAVASLCLFSSSACLLGLLLHHKLKRGDVLLDRDVLLYSATPCATLLTIILFSTVDGFIALFPLLAIPGALACFYLLNRFFSRH